MATKKVRMTVKISGTRNGAVWPDPGELVTLPADEAAALIAARMAIDPDARAAADEEAVNDSLGVETAVVKPKAQKSIRTQTAKKGTGE